MIKGTMRNANISHQDIFSIWGNPYIGVVTKWDALSWQRQESILKDYPDTARIADYIDEAKQNLTLDLAMTDYTTRDFINDMVLVTGAIALDFMCPPSSAYTTPVVATSSIRVMARLASKFGTVAAGLGLEAQRLYKKADNFFKKKASENTRLRIQNTKGEADGYIKGLTDQKGWVLNRGKTKDDHHYYEVMKKFTYKGTEFKRGDYISRDTMHHEIEWFRGKNVHKGALDPVTGKLKPDSIDFFKKLKVK